MRHYAGVVAFLLTCIVMHPALACGQRGDPCKVALGDYYVLQPPSARPDPRPAIVHFHGGGGDGFAVVEDKRLYEPILARGYVLLAPQVLPRPPLGNGWTFRKDHDAQRDELAFLRDIVADAARRANVDRNRVLVTGFSVGGSIVWYLACRAPEEFAAFAPLAGGFWRPHPQTCASPAKILHTHGWDDPVVPLEGRTFNRPNFSAQQGDIFEGLQLWRKTSGCATQAPTQTARTDIYWSRTWSNCARGSHLQLVLHPGGHDMPEFWPRLVMDWFEQIEASSKSAGR